MPDVVIDPLTGPPHGIHGRVVTMDHRHRVIDDATLWIEMGVIRRITTGSDARPEGFDGVPVVRTGGTIYPGMIELHNHLPYDVLGMWKVPKPYRNRGQWGSHDDYRRLVSGPMKVLGKTAGYIEAVIRYVEVKMLVAGVTTSQGVALYSNANTRRYHRGLVRNVEETNDPDLPEAESRVADVDAADADSFLTRLRRGKKLILHLAEGVDETARGHFLALRTSNGGWAVTPELVGIHAAGLVEEDFAVLADNGASIVWSPSSNLMLYGDTARIDAARREGVTVALGSDWSPTGSKNLLAELSVAKAAAAAFGWDLSDRDLADMVTRNAARAVGWDKALGSLEEGKRADLFVLHGRSGDPYERLVDANERSVVLVVVNGVPRYGQSRFMPPGSEPVLVGGSRRSLYLEQETADPVVAEISFSEAVRRLEDGMANIVALARALEEAAGSVSAALGGTRGIPPATELGIARGGERWVIELEEETPDATSTRPSLGRDELLPDLGGFRAAEKLSEILGPMELDPLTVVDDSSYGRRLRSQPNLPTELLSHL